MKKVGDKDARASQEIEQTRQILAQGKKKKSKKADARKNQNKCRRKNGYKEAKREI